MFSLARVFVFVKRRAVESPQSVTIAGEVCRHPVEDDPEHGLVTTIGSRIKRFDYAAGEISLKRGDEMGRFNLGSTVILITTENFELDESIKADAAVYMGRNIGRATGL